MVTTMKDPLSGADRETHLESNAGPEQLRPSPLCPRSRQTWWRWPRSVRFRGQPRQYEGEAWTIESHSASQLRGCARCLTF